MRRIVQAIAKTGLYARRSYREALRDRRLLKRMEDKVTFKNVDLGVDGGKTRLTREEPKDFSRIIASNIIAEVNYERTRIDNLTRVFIAGVSLFALYVSKKYLDKRELDIEQKDEEVQAAKAKLEQKSEEVKDAKKRLEESEKRVESQEKMIKRKKSDLEEVKKNLDRKLVTLNTKTNDRIINALQKEIIYRLRSGEPPAAIFQFLKDISADRKVVKKLYDTDPEMKKLFDTFDNVNRDENNNDEAKKPIP